MKFKKALLSSSSLTVLKVGVITFSLLTNTSSKAEEEYVHAPAVEFSTRYSKKRKIGELSYTQPIFGNSYNLTAADVKLKLDNNKSKEINLGLLYRHNFNDKVILGTYGYFDHRRLSSGFTINGLTAGAELLSKYVDLRANYYLPQNKRKKAVHDSKRQIVLQGTNIFATHGGHTYEYALKGYDIEIGGSLFGFSDKLNETLGTKIFAAKYNFYNKNTKAIKGTRFRLEQKLGEFQLGNNSLQLNLNAETQYDKIRKRQNFVGISLRMSFDNKRNKKPNGLKSRMMDTIIRDVDIVVESQKAPKQISHLVADDGRVIKKMYYVGEAHQNYKGVGTKESPFSIEQIKKADLSDAIVVVTNIDSAKGGKEITGTQYQELKQLPSVINDKKNFHLKADNAESNIHVTFNDKTKGGALTSSDPENVFLIVMPINNEAASVSDFSTVSDDASIQLEAASVLKIEELAAVAPDPIAEVAPQPQPAQQQPQQQPQVAEAARGQEEVQAAEQRQAQAQAAAQQAAQVERDRQAQAQQQRLAQENADRQAQEQQRQAQENADRLAQEQQRQDAERLAQQAAQAERDRQAQAEQQRLAQEQQRQEVARLEAERLAQQAAQVERDRQAQAQQQRLAQENADRQAQEQQRQAQENADRLAQEQQRQDAERLAQQAAQAERDRQAQAEQQRQDAERLRLDAERVEREAEEERYEGLEHLFAEPEAVPAPGADAPRRENINFNSAVDADILDDNHATLYARVVEVTNMEAAPGSDYHIKDVDFDYVNDMVLRGFDLIRTQAAINADLGLNPADKLRRVKIAQAIFSYKGEVNNVAPNIAGLARRPHNVGINIGPKDLSVTSSLVELQKLYGVIDGNKALAMLKAISASVIRIENGLPLNEDIDQLSRDVHHLSEAYNQAHREHGEASNINDVAAREAEKRRLKAIMIHEMNINGNAPANKSLAAYRAIRRIEGTVDNFYTEGVLHRFDAKEYIGYTLKALLDTQEISHNLQAGGMAVTPQNIFEVQKENIGLLLNNLAESQRDHNTDFSAAPDNGLPDDVACAHGTCMRILDSANLRHRSIKFNEFTPQNLRGEFRDALVVAVNHLPEAQRNEVVQFYNDTAQELAEIRIEPGGRLTFTDPDAVVPPTLDNVLNNIALELNRRYNFLNPNPRLQIVKWGAGAQNAHEVLRAFNMLNVRRDGAGVE